ncbi:DUF3090 family protein [Ilumatobacteraceae bacterium]|nr:DUF3090 family protein [Ilumatobacteraceae bacterium]
MNDRSDDPIDERLDDVEVFTAGTVGRPGSRVFFLQIRAAGRRFDLKCEKAQVAAISRYLDDVLQDLPPPEDRPLPAALDMAAPTGEGFILGSIALGYDAHGDRVILQLGEIGGPDNSDDSDDDEPDTDESDVGQIRISVTRGQAAAFREHAEQVVAAGRPPCRWCGGPIDPDGHPCPRMN